MAGPSCLILEFEISYRYQFVIMFSMCDAVIAASWGVVVEACLNFVFGVLLWAFVFALVGRVAAEGGRGRIRKVRIQGGWR